MRAILFLFCLFLCSQSGKDKSGSKSSGKDAKDEKDGVESAKNEVTSSGSLFKGWRFNMAASYTCKQTLFSQVLRFGAKAGYLAV